MPHVPDAERAQSERIFSSYAKHFNILQGQFVKVCNIEALRPSL